MDSLGLTPLISSILFLITFIWMLFVSFRQSLWWGIAILFFSPISTVIFAYSHWDKAKKPVVAYMAALIFYMFTFTSLISSMFGGDVVNTMSDMQDIAEQQQRGELTDQEARQKINTILSGLTEQLDNLATQPGIPGQVNNENSIPEQEQLRKGLERLTGTIPGTGTADDKMINTFKNEQSHSIPPSMTAQKSNDDVVQEIFGRKEEPSKEQLAKQDREANAMHSKITPRKKKSKKNRKPIAYHDLARFMGKSLDIQLSDSRMQSGILDKVTENHIELYRILSGGRFAFEIKRNNIKQVFISQHQE